MFLCLTLVLAEGSRDTEPVLLEGQRFVTLDMFALLPLFRFCLHMLKADCPVHVSSGGFLGVRVEGVGRVFWSVYTWKAMFTSASDASFRLYNF